MEKSVTGCVHVMCLGLQWVEPLVTPVSWYQNKWICGLLYYRNTFYSKKVYVQLFWGCLHRGRANTKLKHWIQLKITYKSERFNGKKYLFYILKNPCANFSALCAQNTSFLSATPASWLTKHVNLNTTRCIKCQQADNKIEEAKLVFLLHAYYLQIRQDSPSFVHPTFLQTSCIF